MILASIAIAMCSVAIEALGEREGQGGIILENETGQERTS